MTKNPKFELGQEVYLRMWDGPGVVEGITHMGYAIEYTVEHGKQRHICIEEKQLIASPKFEVGQYVQIKGEKGLRGESPESYEILQRFWDIDNGGVYYSLKWYEELVMYEDLLEEAE